MRPYTEEARVISAIITWLENAIDSYEEAESEYDPASIIATEARRRVVTCWTHVFKLMTEDAPGDLKWRIGRGMYHALGDTIETHLPCGCEHVHVHAHPCPGDVEA